MVTTTLSLPEVGAIALTRAALGAGVALLVAQRLDARTRRAVGVALVAVGLVSSVPLVVSIVKGIDIPGTSTT